MGRMNLKHVSIDQLLSIQQAADQCPLSVVHLRRLVRQGRVASVRLGKNWYTTAEAVQTYLEHGYRPGPKPKARTKTQVTSRV